MKKTLIGLIIALLCLGVVGTAVAIINLNKENESSVSETPNDNQSQEETNPSEEESALDNGEAWSSEEEVIDGDFALTAIKDLRFYASTTSGIVVKSWEFKNLDTNTTIRDGLNFYAMGNMNPLDQGAYLIDKGQIVVSDDWFTAQVSKAEGAKNFELSVTFGGMTKYLKNDADGRIGISFENKSGKKLCFDLMEKNEKYYLAGLTGAIEEEKGWTKQEVNEEITLKVKRSGDKYTMTCGEQEWNFTINAEKKSGSSTTNETPVWTPPFVQN